MHLFILVLIFSTVYSYNLDIRSSILKNGPRGSYFGYSVALHKQNTGDKNLIIGAPLADTIIDKSGTVYKCNIENFKSGCTQIFLDRFGERRDVNTNEKTESKSGQWLGASISTSPSGSIITCAPRYVHFSVNLKRREPIGLCYILKNLLATEEAEEFTPCKSNSEWGYHRIGSCQAGFSSAISDNTFFVGAPGSYYWQGQAYSYSPKTKTILHTNSSDKTNDDQYKGYSIVSGQFSKSSDKLDVAVGLPKGNKNLSGLVMILNSKMKLVANLKGETLGSYFGYALAALDANGDGFTDLVVSAPMFTQVANNLEYEQGRVYVFYQAMPGVFSKPKVLDGFKSKSRFGQAITSLGNILKKGCDSLAVGAPYDGIENRGIVYIYDGDRNGINDLPSQIIEAENFNYNLRTFGFSLAGNVDMNEDEYPDLLIGAYETDAAVFLKARPVINVVHNFTINPQTISLENKRCRIKNKEVTCVEIQFCLGYNGGKMIPDQLSFIYNLTLDSNHDHLPRMSLIDDDKLNMLIDKRLDLVKNKSLRCLIHKAFIHDDIRDKLTPILVNIHYDLFDNHNPYKTMKELLPMFNSTVKTNLSKNITIQKNCGPDNICIPNLELTVTPRKINNYVVGTNEKLTFNITVHNTGEDAFEAMLLLGIPEDINLVQVKTDVPYQEFSKEKTGFSRIDFDLGNPLSANRKVKITIDFSAKETLISSSSTYNFTFNVTTSNPVQNTDSANNYLEIKVPLRVNVTLEPYGLSYVNGEVKPLMHNVTSELGTMNSKSIYPQIKHSYFLKNRGPSSVKEMQITILWPEKTIDHNNNLFELIAQPRIHITDNTNRMTASCEHLELDVELPIINDKRNNVIESSGTIMLLDNDPIIYNSLIHTNYTNSRTKRENIEFNQENQICDEKRCKKIVCTVREMSENTFLNIDVFARPWNITLREIGQSEFSVTSIMIARIKKLQYNVDPSFMTPTLIKVTTEVNLIDLNNSKPIPSWIIILAVCFGLFLLFLIVLCLWACGFFKRTRPPNSFTYSESLNNDDYPYRK